MPQLIAPQGRHPVFSVTSYKPVEREVGLENSEVLQNSMQI